MADVDGYIIEFIKSGNAIKVTAVDTVTGTEASIVGDPKLSHDRLKALAVQKLEYVLKKQASKKPRKPGWIV